MYIIEDWGTGYWDEQAAHDVTRRSLRGEVQRQPRFESVLITPSIVFVMKAGAWQSTQ